MKKGTNAIPQRERQAKTKLQKRARLTVLHIDDDPNDSELFQAAARRASVAFLVQHVTDGEQAMAYLTGRGIYRDRRLYPLPALVLLDLKMPRATGFDVLLADQSQIGLVNERRGIERLAALLLGHLRRVLAGCLRELEARRGQVTRARLSQIMNLPLLAPDIQEAILFLPRTTSGRDPIQLRHLQPITLTACWQEQRRLCDHRRCVRRHLRAR